MGAGTKVDHIQVSYSNDDSYEWFGGTVNCKYLIAYKGWDDDFDTDNGFSGKVQFGFSLRDSRIADKSQSNGFESDNNAGGSAAEPLTKATFSNTTDNTKPSFSSSFFKEATNGNHIFDDWAAMKLSDLASIIAAGLKDATLSADFTGLSGFDVVNYVGCFSGTNDSWASGWTNFDPENTQY